MLTPILELRAVVDGRPRRLRLKLEGANPCGSLKHRTARSLVRALRRQGALRPGATIVESTSGNLGVALAALVAEHRAGFVAVVDPNVPRELQDAMRDLGAEVRVVAEPDACGGFLAGRLRAVQALVASDPRYVWPNQYESAANPLVHYAETAPEIDVQAGTAQAVVIAVSTGGTFAGVARYFRERRSPMRLVAVDVTGSVALGGEPGLRRVSGIGSSRPSSFITPDLVDAAAAVAEVDAVAMCRVLAAQAGVRVGASSGAVVFACLELMARDAAFVDAVCVCADFGAGYASTVYDDAWAAGLGVPSRSSAALEATLDVVAFASASAAGRT